MYRYAVRLGRQHQEQIKTLFLRSHAHAPWHIKNSLSSAGGGVSRGDNEK
jgi:hypothetical protein